VLYYNHYFEANSWDNKHTHNNHDHTYNNDYNTYNNHNDTYDNYHHTYDNYNHTYNNHNHTHDNHNHTHNNDSTYYYDTTHSCVSKQSLLSTIRNDNIALSSRLHEIY